VIDGIKRREVDSWHPLVELSFFFFLLNTFDPCGLMIIFFFFFLPVLHLVLQIVLPLLALRRR
jgi:hypothetical protein